VAGGGKAQLTHPDPADWITAGRFVTRTGGIVSLRGMPFDHPDWVFEPKYDGFRGLLQVTPAGAGFTSKRGLPLKRFADSN
jgi:hypothetical protein